MNESYSTKNSLKNSYVSLDSLTDMINELAELEADVFAGIDGMGLAPSSDCMNKIYSFL